MPKRAPYFFSPYAPASNSDGKSRRTVEVQASSESRARIIAPVFFGPAEFLKPVKIFDILKVAEVKNSLDFLRDDELHRIGMGGDLRRTWEGRI